MRFNLFLNSFLSYLFFLLFLFSCTTQKKLQNSNQKTLQELLKEKILSTGISSSAYIGFTLFDPQKKEYIYQHNGDKYFLPASNTKIFTFFVADKILSDTIPTFLSCEEENQVILYPYGDPSFLHPDFEKQWAFDKLKEFNTPIKINFSAFQDEKYGEGWNWDDYNYSFLREKTPLPIYGNAIVVSVDSMKKISLFPEIEHKMTNDSTISIQRNLENNTININIDKIERNKNHLIPLKWSKELCLQLLSDTLHRPVTIDTTKNISFENCILIYNTEKKKLFEFLLKKSDNFIAEQLLLLCSQKIFQLMNTEKIIEYGIKNHLDFLPQKILWIDGSGTSRYNLFTPFSITHLLFEMYKNYSKEEIQELFHTPILSSKQEISFQNQPAFIFAKTGTLRNQYNLSGYIKNKENQWRVFCFMANNFEIPNKEIKEMMYEILYFIHEN